MSLELADDVGFEEAPDTTAVSAPAGPETQTALAITKDMSRVKAALAELDRVEASLPDIAKNFPVDAIYEITTTKGMKDAVAHRAAWRDPRITVEKARKMAKAPILALGKNIDARAAKLTEQLEIGEEQIDKLIKVEEQRKEDERQWKINAEAGRVLAIQEALAEVSQDVLIACTKTSADVAALLERMRSTQPDPLVFQEQIEQARAAWAAGIVKLEIGLKAKLWEEAEARRIEAERAAEAARFAEAQAEAARVRAQAEAQQLAMKIGASVMSCMGKPAAHVRQQLDLLLTTAYAPGTADMVLAAHDGAIEHLYQLLELATEKEAREAELAALRAAAVPIAPAPVPPAPAPVPAPTLADKDVADANARAFIDCIDSAATHVPPQIAAEDAPGLVLDSGEFVPACELNALETSEGDAQPASDAAVRSALERSLPAGRVDADLLALVNLFVADFMGARGPGERFPSHPKPSREWWDGMFDRGEKLLVQIGGAA